MIASRPAHLETRSLTGLRGIAALSVLLAHYSVWCAPYDRETAPGWLARGMDSSAWGMSLFFTLSGFVIAYNYLGMDWGGRAAASAGRFAWLRFSRLYPVLLIYLVLIFLRPSVYGDQTLTAHALLLFSLESLYPFKINGQWLTDPLSWSISTEIALYAMFVGCVVVFRKARQRFGRAATVSAAVVAAFYLVAVAWLIRRQEVMIPVVRALPSAFDPVPPRRPRAGCFTGRLTCAFTISLLGGSRPSRYCAASGCRHGSAIGSWRRAARSSGSPGCQASWGHRRSWCSR